MQISPRLSSLAYIELVQCQRKLGTRKKKDLRPIMWGTKAMQGGKVASK